MRLLLDWLCFLACCCVVAVAQAEAAGSRVVLLDPEAPALFHRLRDEIESLGFVVLVVAERHPPESLEESARTHSAVAAIRVSHSGLGVVEMTIVDRATGKTVRRRLAIATPSDPASAELIATRTVELLRASLMELAATHPPRGDVPITPELRRLSPALAAESHSTLAIELGPALVHSPGFDVAAEVSAALALVLPSGIGGSAQVVLPLTAAELVAPEGTVRLETSLYRLSGLFETEHGPVVARVQTGVALARLALRGSAQPPFRGSEQDLAAYGPWVGAGVRVRLTRTFRLVLAADTGWFYPRSVIRSAGREVSTWGRPASGAGVGVEVALP